MKKFVVLLLAISAIIISVLCMDFKEKEIDNINVNKFNLEYEKFNKDSLSGLEVATAINKAIDNNETLEVERTENGFYILNDENSIEIYVTFNSTETTYQMERLYGLGMQKFIENFGSVEFKCTDVKYHKKTGRIASMVFEAIEY